MTDRQTDPEEYDIDSEAFENFFDNWYIGNPDKPWGPKIWKVYGVSIENNKIVFDSPAHRTMFILKWA